MAYQILNSGHPFDTSLLNIVRHVANRRLLDAYKGLEKIKWHNLMNNYRVPIPFSTLYNSIK